MSKKRPKKEDLDIYNMKVTELKNELSTRGLDITGKKAELIARLEEAIEVGTSASKKVKVEKLGTVSSSLAAASASDASINYDKMTLTDIKKELKARGLKTIGKRQELVNTLLAVKKEDVGNKEQEEVDQLEESDFSKARKALVSVSGKKKQKKRKAECTTLVNCEVFEDWDCMLNQTNIGHNNNKFYVIQLLKHGKSYNMWTRWGRVGEYGEKCLGPTGDLETVKKQFKKKFSDKTKNKWENRDDFKPVPGKYTLLEMDGGSEEEEESPVQEETDTGTGPNVLPCTLDKPTQELVKLIFSPNTFMDAMQKMALDLVRMPLGKLSKAQIAKGIEALEAIEDALDKSQPRSVLTELTSKFYTIIPHNFGRQVPPVISDKGTLQMKFDMLVVLGDIEMALEMQSTKDKKQSDIEIAHKLDTDYRSLKCDLTLVDPSSHEYHVVSRYVKATGGQGNTPQIMHMWKVDRHSVDQRFKEHASIENRRLLWHGTNLAVVAAILKSGLRIMPHSGGRVGKGIYHASENSMSAWFVRPAPDGTGIMFLNEVALGKEYHITMDDSSLTAPPTGFDSVIAKGRVEPDPKKDIVMKMDGKDVMVPQGKPIECKLGSYFYQSEYLVYKESQTRIRYMLQMKFSYV